MCGCMLMHAAMGHEEHNHSSTASSAPAGVERQVNSLAGKCAHCGYPLQAGFAFCPSCGMKLHEGRCPACGQKTEASWRTCAYCGSPLGQVDGQPLPA